MKRVLGTAISFCLLMHTHHAWSDTGENENSRIWYEEGLGSIYVGFDKETRGFVYRKFYLVAYGPYTTGSASHRFARNCTASITRRTGTELRKALFDLEGLRLHFGDQAAEDKAVAAQDHRVDALVNTATAAFRDRLRTCAGDQFNPRLFEVGLIQRVCSPIHRTCSGTPESWARHPMARAFTTLSLWINARDKGNPTLPVNGLVLLPDAINISTDLDVLGATDSDEALVACRLLAQTRQDDEDKYRPLPPTCLQLEVAARPFIEATDWPDPPSDDVAQALFENLVKKSRDMGRRIDQSATIVTNIPKEIAIRFVDALDEPQMALQNLRSDANATLLSLQDEIARSRIRECVNMRAVFNPKEASLCSGYKLDSHTMNSCLAGEACIPPLNSKGSIYGMTIFRPAQLPDIASANSLPRLGAGYDEFVAQMVECGKQPNRAASSKCVLEKQLGKAQTECLKGLPDEHAADGIIKCLSGRELPANVKEAVQCHEKHVTDSARMDCIIAIQLPSDVKDLVECHSAADGDEGRLVSCLANRKGGGLSDGAAGCIVEELQKENRGWQTAAECYAQKKVPKEVINAVECSERSGGDVWKTAGCMAVKELDVPEDLQKPVQCYVQSSGSTGGFALCMAAGDLDLTDDQRIAVECATASGDLYTFAVCTGGRMAVDFVAKCADKRVFEGNCIGKNNDLRKAFEAIGLKLTPKSPVGRYVNAYWDVAKFQIAAGQSILEGADHFVREVGDELKRADRNISRELKRANRNGGRFRDQVESNARGAGRAVRKFGKSVGRTVRSLF